MSRRAYWTRPEAAARILWLAHGIGRTPTSRDLLWIKREFPNSDVPSHETVRRLFGGIRGMWAYCRLAQPPSRPRKTHCVQGHPYTPENRWRRECRVCKRERHTRWRVSHQRFVNAKKRDRYAIDAVYRESERAKARAAYARQKMAILRGAA